MSEGSRTRLFRKKRVRPYRGRGEVYAWLRAHHARVFELAASWAWADLVQEMLRDGLQGRGGAVPTPKAVTKVWQRVCRDMQAGAAAPAVGPKRKPPSHISPEWRPVVVPAASGHCSTRASAPAPLAPASNGSGGLPAKPTSMEAPFDFPTVDPDGNPLPEGMVFYEGRARPRHGAEESEKMLRRMRAEDRFR